MKKRIIILFTIIFVVTILLLILGIHYEEPIIEPKLQAEGVTMEIVAGTLTRTGATVLITDISENNNIYGKGCKIEKKENNEWVKLETINEEPIIMTMEGYRVNSENKLYMNLNWKMKYGELENGEYRLIKTCGPPADGSTILPVDKYFYTEFTITDEIK